MNSRLAKQIFYAAGYLSALFDGFYHLSNLVQAGNDLF